MKADVRQGIAARSVLYSGARRIRPCGGRSPCAAASPKATQRSPSVSGRLAAPLGIMRLW